MEKLLNNFKIAFTKGDTYALAVKIKNITDDLNSAYFTVKENPEDEPLIQKTLGAGVDKIDDRAYKNEKTYKIQLQSEDTANLEPLVQYLYDFRVAIGNVVKTLISGVFVVNHSISEVTTTITSTLEVAIEDTVESELSTTSPTSGIEYEQDPVACAKIGDMTTLATTNKDTIVKAINEVNTVTNAVKSNVDKILNGTITVPKSTNAETATYANNASESDLAVECQKIIAHSISNNIVVTEAGLYIFTVKNSGDSTRYTLCLNIGNIDLNYKVVGVYYDGNYNNGVQYNGTTKKFSTTSDGIEISSIMLIKYTLVVPTETEQ